MERVRVSGDTIMITPSGDVGIGSSVRRRGDNIPDTNDNTTGENNNTSTTGNISDNIWEGDTSSTTGNISDTWGSCRLNITGNKEDDDRIKAEKQIIEFVYSAVRKVLDEDRQNLFNLKQYVVTK